MREHSDRHGWVTTDRDTIERMVGRRDGAPAAVPDDAPEDAGAPRIREADDADLVETDWEEFFERLDERDLGVAVDFEGDDISFDVVPVDESADRQRGGEPPAAVQQLLEDEPRTDDPTAAHNEAAREETNPDNYRDEPPFNS